MGWVFHATPEAEELSRWPMLVGVVSTMLALAMLVVGSRLWIRHNYNRLSLDDLFATLSLIFAMAYTSLAIARTSSPPTIASNILQVKVFGMGWDANPCRAIRNSIRSRSPTR